MKTVLAAVATALMLAPLAGALAQDSGTPAQPTVGMSYGGMSESPTRGYYKQPKVTYGTNFETDSSLKGPAPKVQYGYGSTNTNGSASFMGNPAPRPVQAQHQTQGTSSHS